MGEREEFVPIAAEAIQQELIKPCSPTPSHLKTCKLSLLDQLQQPYHTPFFLFYGDVVQEKKKNISSERLKTSLSQVLTDLYPLAGRLSEDLSVINCNDEGVHYEEARAINFSLTAYLQHPNLRELWKFTTVPPYSELRLHEIPLLLVKVTFFKCGGVVLALSMSHAIADAASINTFAKAWASTTAGGGGGGGGRVEQLFDSASLFPPQHPLPISQPTADLSPQPTSTTAARRFVFDATKIAALKVRASSASVPQPTRMEAVSALIWKCSTEAAIACSRTARPSVLRKPVNIRSRLTPRLPDSSFGNFVIVMVDTIRTINEKKGRRDPTDDQLPAIVCRMRQHFEDFRRKYVDKLQESSDIVPVILGLHDDNEKEMTRVGEEEAYKYTHNSYCRMGSYEVDFGWGSPTWVSMDGSRSANRVLLCDTRDGNGVEACICLEAEEMVFLEHDPEFLEFATLNPSTLLQANNLNRISPL